MRKLTVWGEKWLSGGRATLVTTENNTDISHNSSANVADPVGLFKHELCHSSFIFFSPT